MISSRTFQYFKLIASPSRKLLTVNLTCCQQSNLLFQTVKYHNHQLIPIAWISRAASSTANPSPPFLSDVEELVQRDLTFKDIEKEILPILPTTKELLENCKTFEDLFEVVNNAVQSSRLWKEELPLYIQTMAALKRKTERERQSWDNSNLVPNVGTFEVEQTESILDDPHLQYLVKESLTHALHFTSHDLTQIFNSFVVLGIPPSSNVMSLLVAILQKRINDFFPEDVLRCFNALRLLSDDAHLFDSLKKGLLMHLENQALDHVNFTQVLLGSSLINQLRLLKYVQRMGGASLSLKSIILFTCTETVKRRQRQSLTNENEMRNVLKTLTVLGRQHKFLLRSAANYIRDHKETMLSDHSDLVDACIVKLKLEDKVLLRRLLMCRPDWKKVKLESTNLSALL